MTTSKPRPKIWLWLLGTPVALAVAVVLLVRAGTPEYKRTALRVRDACEKIAAPDQRYVCDEQYQQALSDGREAAAQ